MNLEQMKKALREALKWLAEYRDLKPEDRTEEKRAEKDTKLAEVRQLEADIREFEEMEEIERRNRSDNDPTPVSGRITVEDQPIYRGRFPLGQQMRDVYVAGNPYVDGDKKNEARSRLEQSEKRSREFHNLEPEKRAAGTGGMIEGVAGDGGALLQGETALDLMTHGFNNSEVLRRCDSRTISGQKVEVITLKETSRANGSRGGGIRVYTDKELGLMTQSKTEFDKYEIEPKKLTGMYYASDEILEDVPMLEGEMSSLFREEFAFKGQDLVINGSGSGEPLGILYADALVIISKETGQIAATIVTENILKMYERFSPRGTGASIVWLANRDTFRNLFQLTYEIGTGGEMARLYMPPSIPGGTGSMLGYPVVFIEQAQTIGTKGDIYLVDLSRYMTANKGGINSAMSIHLKFDYNQTAFRFVYRFDGQPKERSAITPYKGTNTVSPFVALADRS